MVFLVCCMIWSCGVYSDGVLLCVCIVFFFFCFFFCFFLFVFFLFFFFKQKTAYEIGTGDWSSDVCSSDLGKLFTVANCLDSGNFSASTSKNTAFSFSEANFLNFGFIILQFPHQDRKSVV